MNEKKYNISEKNIKLLEEKLKNIIPLDDNAFSYFAKDINFCQEFLRVILEDEKLVVLDNDPQKKLSNVYFKESILDMLCKLSDGRIVNVEIQLYKDEDSAKRIFQYASMIRESFVKKGTKYSDICDIIIIYLTKDDIFGKGNTTYSVDMNIVSDTNEYVDKWNCGLKVLYVNTKGDTKELLNEYLKLLLDMNTYNNKYPVTTNLKKDLFDERRDNMSGWFKEMLDEERALGREDGREEGEERGQIMAIKKLIDKGLISAKDAAETLNVSMKKFNEMVAML